MKLQAIEKHKRGLAVMVLLLMVRGFHGHGGDHALGQRSKSAR